MIETIKMKSWMNARFEMYEQSFEWPKYTQTYFIGIGKHSHRWIIFRMRLNWFEEIWMFSQNSLFYKCIQVHSFCLQMKWGKNMKIPMRLLNKSANVWVICKLLSILLCSIVCNVVHINFHKRVGAPKEFNYTYVFETCFFFKHCLQFMEFEQ